MSIADKFAVIAHRGASARAPENTLAAFDLALEMGAKHIELDIRTTRDGRVAVLHDPTLDRTTNGSGPVSETDWADVRKLDAGAWFGPEFAGQRVPSLDEALQRCQGKARLHIELKDGAPDMAAKTLDLIESRGMAGQVALISFRKEWLAKVRALAPDIQTGYLVREADDEAVAWAKANGVGSICPKEESLTPELVPILHEQGLGARFWSVRDEAAMRRVIESGADGMTVNFPDRAFALLREMGDVPFE